MGFNGQDTPGYNDNVYAGTNGYAPTTATIDDQKWINNLRQLISVYDDVDFVRVTESGRRSTPDGWQGLTNLRQISYRDFVLETDL
mgnify:CR=1 FL=1